MDEIWTRLAEESLDEGIIVLDETNKVQGCNQQALKHLAIDRHLNIGDLSLMSMQDKTSKCDLDLESVTVHSDQHGMRPLTWFVSVLHDRFDCEVQTREQTKTLKISVKHVKMH